MSQRRKGLVDGRYPRPSPPPADLPRSPGRPAREIDVSGFCASRVSHLDGHAALVSGRWINRPRVVADALGGDTPRPESGPFGDQSSQNILALFSTLWKKPPLYRPSSGLIVKAKEGARSTCSPARTIKHPAYKSSRSLGSVTATAGFPLFLPLQLSRAPATPSLESCVRPVQAHPAAQRHVAKRHVEVERKRFSKSRLAAPEQNAAALSMRWILQP